VHWLWSSDLIPVTLVKEYAWCPLIPWLIYNTGFEPPETPSMERGVEESKAMSLEEAAERASLPQPRRFNVYVESRRLGVKGFIDVVAGSRRLVVAEVKAFRSKRWGHFRAQLMVYAALANSALGPVAEAVLVMGGDVKRFPVTDRDLAEARRLIDETRRVLASPEPPRVTQPEAKCFYCRYRKMCPNSPV